MAGADAPGLHLIEVAILEGDGSAPANVHRGADRSHLAAVRAARPVVDGLDRSERGAIAAVMVACAGEGPPHGGALADRVRSSLALGASTPLAVSGPGACSLFTALHVAGALVRNLQAARVLLISLGATSAGAFLLAGEGGVALGLLPPARAPLAGDVRPEADARLYGAALAASLREGGVRPRSVRRVLSLGMEPLHAARSLREAGLAHALASSGETRLASCATAEAALFTASRAPRVAPTLLWACGLVGCVEGCIIAPERN